MAEKSSVCRSVEILLDDPPHVGQKTHVEHAIDFVEDEDADLAHVHRALLEQIEQPPGRRADDVGSASRFLFLFAVADAAVHDRDAQIGEAPVIAKGRLDLRRELARRLEHKTAKGAVPGEQGHDRQREGRRLAGAGLRGPDQIFAGENDWKCAELDRRWLGKAHRLCSPHDFRGKPEVVERHRQQH